MRVFRYRRGGLVPVIPGLLAVVVAGAATAPALGDEPGILGRLFRLGGSSSPAPANRGRQTQPPNPLPYGPDANAAKEATRGDNFVPPAAPRSPSTASAPTPTPTAGPLGEGPSTPEPLGGNSAPPIAPRSRVSSAATSADPILTRVALGRSTDGSQFGMFMQIYADGTVIDSEGIHRMAAADIQPIADLVASGDLSRARGHCGAPSSDFIEDVQVIVYERRLGRLAAQSFSYSGNPQDCDHPVKHLHALVESLQMKLSGQPAPATPSAGPAPLAANPAGPPVVATGPAPGGNAPILSSPAPAPLPTGAVIPLTPVDER